MKRKIEVPTQIREAFEAKRNECVRIAREKTGKDIPTFPLIFSQMGRRAGVCVTSIDGSVIKINPDYFKNPKDYEQQLNDTVPHEIAHAVVDFLYPPWLSASPGRFALNKLTMVMNRQRRRPVPPHGREWEQVMNWFGIKNPNRTHQMDTTGVVLRKTIDRPFKYFCSCKTHMLSLNLHKKIQEQGRQRKCKLCHQRIVYERQLGKPVKSPSINLRVERVIPKVMIVTANTPKPEPPATHRTVTRFVNGMLQNVRIPL